MSSSPNPAPQPNNDDEIPVSRPAQSFAENPPLAPNFEEQLQEFWAKYSRTIFTVLTVTLVAILARGGYDYFQAIKEEGIARDYNAAITNDQLRSFATQQSSHTLGGVASLRLADDSYSNGKYTEAASLYEKAAAVLKTGPLGGRAQLGAALSRLQAGQASEAEKALRALADDASQLKTVRAEAAYHLGSHWLATGRADDGNKSLDQAAAIDPTSAWAERALSRKTPVNP